MATERKSALKTLNGWKTAIAAVYWPVIYQIAPIWYPDGIPATVNKVIMTIGILLTIFGVGHKWYKKTHGEDWK